MKPSPRRTERNEASFISNASLLKIMIFLLAGSAAYIIGIHLTVLDDNVAVGDMTNLLELATTGDIPANNTIAMASVSSGGTKQEGARSPILRERDSIILLNETASLFHANLATPAPPASDHLLRGNKTQSLETNNENKQPPVNIDILIIGSKHQLNKPRVQKETWATHPSRRHFFLATEYDDLDPECDQHYETLEDLKQDVMTCKARGLEISPSAPKFLRVSFKNYFTRMEWLKKRKSPGGWYCAQRRHSIGLAKVTALYQAIMAGSSSSSDYLPDYLFIGDDDSYVNLHHLSELLIHQPQRLEAMGISQEHSIVPTHDTPVVWAGCRVRWPIHQVNFTFAYGGFGYFFSKASLERLIHPLYCNSTNVSSSEPTMATTSGTVSAMSLYEKDACERLKPENALIGEDRFFTPGKGMSLMDVWEGMATMKPFCMHADWIFGYFVNFFNISRHTVHTNGGNWFDDRFADNPVARLHALTPDSEIYRKPEGLCKMDDKCATNATLCHHISEDIMRETHTSYLASI